jgi:predicted aconitase with swiveling domain
MVQGAAAAGIPLVAGVDDAIFTALENHQLIRLDPKARQVTILDPGVLPGRAGGAD